MTPMLMALVAAASLVVAVAGYHVMRSTGLESVAASLAGTDAVQEHRPALARVIDALGLGLLRFLLSLYGPRRRAALDARLARAGRPEGLTERSFLRRKAGFTVIGLVIGGLMALAGQPFLGFVVVVLCAGWMDVWLRSVIGRRRRDIARRLPDFLDVLAVTVSAGLALQPALNGCPRPMTAPSVRRSEEPSTTSGTGSPAGRR